MSKTAIAVSATGRVPFSKLLTYAMCAVVCVHAIAVVVIRPNPVALSRFLTAAIPVLAGTACLWRAKRLPARERPIWLWFTAGLFLWALAHVVETLFGHSPAASNLSVDASDFIYRPAHSLLSWPFPPRAKPNRSGPRSLSTALRSAWPSISVPRSATGRSFLRPRHPW